MDALLRSVDIERAVPAMLSTLDTAGLSERAIGQFLRAGACSVLAAGDVLADRLYQFGVGGITPSGQRICRTGYDLREVKHYSDALASTLMEQKYRMYYIHDPLKRQHEADESDGPTLTVEEELLYVQDATRLTHGEFSGFVSKNSLSWHFLMFCTRTPFKIYERMSDLFSESDCVVSGIYDGESYMIWRAMREAR
jgi:hypothetical protein